LTFELGCAGKAIKIDGAKNETDAASAL